MKKQNSRATVFPPTTISAPALMVDGGDDAFRRLVDNLMLFADQIQDVRQNLSTAMGVTQPQYKILMILAHDDEHSGMTLKRLANEMSVSPSFAVLETKKLIERGLLQKKASATDGRSINLHLTDEAIQLITEIGPIQRRVNDKLFGGLSRNNFRLLAQIVDKLIAGYQPALDEARKHAFIR
ncbi:MarR family winged helix-turn-helix transcriptional regulator [Bradyrhizobium sp. JYMT SZCCT0428]|uniref:MarR family winged helix-turn-helix transcriptional regulator n=1 Tax=Bradyrhizobium sp. JYMT SZCCT0428 TaxID=2807673 RepID=UPI001BA53FA0|nr:MarR family transcriptional regulator [Bradyrhizobium sp. JYMT SZCCT0428]MBR1154072.1 MarR family transcriptional regulator [Bradyrhizobium sp. JYMT SZCCT0428]